MQPKTFNNDNLTKSQAIAVNHIDGPLLVIAGPGSGKTRVITSRIENLIRHGVRPWNICAITFTNKAAEEMRERLVATGIPSVVVASTFHSLCVRLLRKYAQQASLSSNFSIYDTADQKRCVKAAIKACDVDTTNFTPAKMLENISKLKNDLEDVESVKEHADNYYQRVVGRVYEKYQKTLTKNNALDFDDLLMKTAFLLRDDSEVREELSDRFKYLLVDEYQDTNHAQYQIAKGLSLAHRNLCVTGDPDQSIYRWRGADISNILQFEKDWPEAVVVKLEENFRSTPNILEMADKLIANNTNRKQKRLLATLPAGSDINITPCSDEAEESSNVAEKIKEFMDEEGVDLNEIAIFYRVNAMSRTIEEALIREQIPYQVIRGVEFYARKEIRDMVSYLKLIVNPDDDVAFVRAVGTHSRGIGKTTVDRIVAYADTHLMSLYEALKHAYEITTIAKGTQGKLASFAAMIESCKLHAAGKVAPLMAMVFKDTGLSDVLQSAGEAQQTARENITELIDSAAKYDQQAEEPSLVDYLQSIALYSDTDTYESESGKVSLMTLHAAKGLEFNNVFIVGLEENILPHERSLQGSSEELEEERRLFFVGITRARKNLSISFARHRVLRGQFLRTTPSQFLYEIGFDYNQFQFGQTFDSAPAKDDYEPESQVVPSGPVYHPNELVRHSKFGLGRVKEFLDLGENSIVVVRFNTGQTKSLMLAYAKLEKVEI